VHCGHKANIMKLTDGMFLDRFRAIAAGYPEIATGDVIVDALCMNLVMRPQQYRMVVLPNLQGDIVSDLAAGLVGGLGFAPSANIGSNISIFEAVHGTAPDIAGKGLANPTALVLSGLMMLRHIGLVRHAATIENALLAALESGVHTGDFGDPAVPAVVTSEFTQGIIRRLGSEPRTVKPAAAPASGSDSVTARPPQRPSEPVVMHTFTGLRKEIVGVDMYLDGKMPAKETAADLERTCEGTPFRLSLISCRGTQVWPRGSVFTECVDYWRARFELRDGMSAGQREAVALMGRVADRHVVTEYALLRTFDGVRGFSMAQGQ
jgi:isocitrate dehydrogenase